MRLDVAHGRPQEPSSDHWWADVLADPRARRRGHRASDLPLRRAFYRLADEKREIILVACSKCDWRAAFARDELIAAHGAQYAMPNLLNHLAAPGLQQARLSMGSLRRVLRRADRGRAVAFLIAGCT